MKRAVILILVAVFLVPAAQADNKGWPDELADVRRMVRATVGDVPYQRVKVRRDGEAIDVSIRLKNVPRHFKTLAKQEADDEDIFIGTNIVDLFRPDIDVSQDFDLTPIADLLDYYFGFGAFNFGKKCKVRASIIVVGPNGTEFENVKKKYKLRKNSVQLRFLERGVSGPGLYLLETEVGPWRLPTYFCSSCG